MNLPRVGGLDLLRIIRDFHPDVRGLLMTATPDWVAAQRRDTGTVLEKPFASLPVLLETVRRALG